MNAFLPGMVVPCRLRTPMPTTPIPTVLPASAKPTQKYAKAHRTKSKDSDHGLAPRRAGIDVEDEVHDEGDPEDEEEEHDPDRDRVQHERRETGNRPCVLPRDLLTAVLCLHRRVFEQPVVHPVGSGNRVR